jgi:hypothetical protein
MPTVIATPGAPDANSYLTVADAGTYFAARRGGGAWGDDAEEQAVALISATRLVDEQDFPGTPTDADQALRWPRRGVRFDGRTLASDEIPGIIERATAETALWLMQDEPSLLEELAGISEARLGPLQIKVAGGKPRSLPDAVLRILRPLRGLGAYQFRRVRA